MIAAYDLSRDRLYGHIKQRKGRVEFLEFCRYIRSLYPAEVRLHFVLDNFSPCRRLVVGRSSVGVVHSLLRAAGVSPGLDHGSLSMHT